MTFRNPQLRQLFQHNVEAGHETDEQLRPVFGLMAVLDQLRFTEPGPSAQVAEVMELLCSAEMRPALKAWYRRAGDDINPAARHLREKLSLLVGEQLAAGGSCD